MHNRNKIKICIHYFLLVLIIIYLILPFVWTFFSSLKIDRDLYNRVAVVDIRNLTLSRYIEILVGGEKLQSSPGAIVGGETLKNFKSGYLNSIIVSSGVTIVCLFFGTLAAYAFCRFKSRLINGLFIFVITTRFLPVIVIIVSLLILIRRIGLMDTKLGLIIVYIAFSLPIVVWIMASFFETIPIEIEESARIDGCSRLRIIFKIILPLSVPAIATSGLIAFVGAWNEFLFALIFTSSRSSKTLPVVMAEFFGRQGMDLGMTCAGAILATIPIVILAFIGQKYIVKGLVAGSLIG